MSLKNFMILSSISFGMLGLCQTLIPNLTHPLWGISSPNDAVLFMSERWGIMSLAVGLMTWLSRNQSVMEAKPLLVGCSFLTAMTGGITVFALSASLIKGPMAWFAVFFEFTLAIGFTFFLLRKKTIKKT